MFTGPSSSSTEVLDCFGDVLFSNFAHRVCCQIGKKRATVHSMHLRILSLGIIWPVTVGNARLRLPEKPLNPCWYYQLSATRKQHSAAAFPASAQHFLTDGLPISFISCLILWEIELWITSCCCTAGAVGGNQLRLHVALTEAASVFHHIKILFFPILLPDRVKTTCIIFNDLQKIKASGTAQAV